MPTTKVKFITEWTPEQFKGMQAAIVKHFRKKTIWSINSKGQIVPRTFKGIDEVLGLAYTSSSSCAMYGICNVDIDYNNHYRYTFFAIGQDGKYYAECWDKDENELIVEL